MFQGLGDVTPGRRAVALGTFDGVHLGHRAVVRAAVAAAAHREATACAATFHPRPVTVLRPGTPSNTLAGVALRTRLLLEAGADEVALLRFDRGLAVLDAERFVRDVLVERLGTVAVAVGRDFRFGSDRSGDVALLERLGAEHGFEVEAIELLGQDGERISSSRIRGLIAEGRVDRAAQLLGRPPSVEGTVQHGDKRGREIGFPTANLGVVPGQQLPAEGIYAGWALVPPGEIRHPAAISVGRNPHFGDVDDLRIEAHLLDYAGDELYGTPLRLEFVSMLRVQEVYDGVEALLAQINRDVAETRRRLAV
ncbi:MAG: bifunctional riboflavin kinase/FAD synthetase [Actinobacteria bacterium]|nr:bifunctional riboflavin kinase/FAD synthetase [Actinomycetota bacterium]